MQPHSLPGLADNIPVVADYHDLPGVVDMDTPVQQPPEEVASTSKSAAGKAKAKTKPYSAPEEDTGVVS